MQALNCVPNLQFVLYNKKTMKTKQTETKSAEQTTISNVFSFTLCFSIDCFYFSDLEAFMVTARIWLRQVGC